MGILSNYENLDAGTVPNNVDKFEPSCPEIIRKDIPKAVFDIYSNFIGYEIHMMDNISIPFTVNKKIKVPMTSIVYRQAGLSPNNTVEGYYGQKAYNTIDCTSYTCYGYNINGYIWETDDVFVWDDCGTRTIELTPGMADSVLEVNLYDFRGKLLLTKNELGSNTLEWQFTEEDYKSLYCGMFRCEVNLIRPEYSEIIDTIQLIIL